MPPYVIAPAAVDDIESILAWTHQQFGEKARLRYEALLVCALADVASQPERAGTSTRPEIAVSIRTYHLVHSLKRVGRGPRSVRQPRHFILYRTRRDGSIEIGRVLHDSMDLARHLPEEFQSGAGGETM